MRWFVVVLIGGFFITMTIVRTLQWGSFTAGSLMMLGVGLLVIVLLSKWAKGPKK